MINANGEAMFDAPWRDLHRNRCGADLMDVHYVVKDAQYTLDRFRCRSTVSH